MIIEVQADDHIIYSDATTNDFMRVVENAHILRTHSGDTIERVETPKGQELYCHTVDSNGLNTILIAEYNKAEQEMTVYF